MKLVLIERYSDNCTYTNELYYIFEDSNIYDAKYHLFEIQEENKKLYDEYNSIYNKKLEDIVRNMRGVIPEAPILKLNKFCGLECVPDTENISYEIITLDNWINNHSCKR